LPTKQDWERSGRLAADYLIAKTDGKAQVLEFTENETKSVVERTDAFEQEMAKCGGCKILQSANFTYADIASTVPSLAQQAAQAHPSYDSVFVAFDAAVPSFLQGFKAIGATNKIIVSGDGSSDANKCIAQACGLNATAAFPLPWIGWADIDAANRVFNHTNPQVAAAALPVKLITKQNSPGDNPWDGDFDFQAAYKKIWGVG
jgi:ribose transport system substrate-binding protein